MPSFTGAMHEDLYSIIMEVAPPDTYITTNFEQVRSMVREGSLQKILVIQGAMNCSSVHNEYSGPGGQINAKTAYDLLKKENEDLEVVVIDGWDWKIPKQYILPKDSIASILKKELNPS